MDAPKISVIIVSYNFEKYIKECIESVLAQTLTPFEIIVCDDHSTDNSWDIIATFQKLHSNLIRSYRRETNLGARKNALQAIEVTSGDLISIIDGDDRWLPGKLEKEWAALQNNPTAKIAYSNVYTIDEAGERTGNWHETEGIQPPSGDIFRQVISGRIFPHRLNLYRQELIHRSVFEKVDFDDEQVEIFLDLDFKIRASALFEAAYSGEPLVEYRMHEKGIHNVPFDRLFKDYVAVLIKNLELVRSRCDGDSRTANQLITDRIYEWVGQIHSESDVRSILLEKLDSEYKRILHEAEQRMVLINRQETECAQLREANHELHEACDERLRLIEDLEKVAGERLQIIQTLEAECSNLRRKNAAGKPIS